ncbi:MAG: acyltransferase [Candidatus Asgardarchaeia archaeon]
MEGLEFRDYVRMALVPISIIFATLISAVIPIFIAKFLYETLGFELFLVFLAPITLICYAIFVVFLAITLSTFRHIVPFVPDGVYKKKSKENIYYELRLAYFSVFKSFMAVFSHFMNFPHIYRLFGCKVGKGTIIGTKNLVNLERCEIGENCYLGANSLIVSHVYEGDKLILKKVKIGNNVTIGAYSIILCGVVIEDGVTIGAGTVIPKNKVVPRNTIWIGMKPMMLNRKK